MDLGKSVRGTEILSTDSPRQYRQKLARIAMDEMYQFVAVLDASGTLLDVNRAALEGAGLRLSDVEGKPFWKCFWWAVSSEIQQTLKAAIAQAALGEFVRYDVEVYGRAGGNETIIIDFSMIPVKNEAGQVVYIVPEGRDITEKKAYEREVAQKNDDLQALLTRIRELDDIKTQFFANVSHELRTPLALIIGPAERLMNPSSEMSPQARRAAGQVIVRNARMLLKHVNDLLEISKLEAGKLNVELQDTDIAALMRFTASHFTLLADEREIDFQVASTSDVSAAVDPAKLQRVLMNLLSNAFKFVPQRGSVFCNLDVRGDDLVLSVEDSGPGVKPELRKMIFQRFHQGDGGASRQYSGTGLGLAIAHEFVEMHKGRIKVGDSTLGGALFQVIIPMRRLHIGAVKGLPGPESIDHITLDGLLEELRVTEPHRPRSESAVCGQETKPVVLVVEDNHDMNQFVAQCLSQDYDVICAFDGHEGLEKALAVRPALIVSDIMMPRVSGEQMIAELRKRPEMDNIPIVLLSAKADDELRLRLLEEGAQDFVVKPFMERDLRVRVRNLVAVKQAGEALRAADVRKDEFLAALAHELRNPLAPLRHAATMSRAAHATETQLKWSHDVIDRQLDHLSRLLDELLDVSRITRGKLELRKERMGVNDHLRAAVEAVRPQIEERGHELIVDVPERTCHVEADPVRFAQIFSNLLTNAAKYTKPGGRINVRAIVDAESVEVTVQDNGIGLAPDLLPRVFEMFSQATATPDRSQGGLGMGLSRVRGLVLLHGGTIEARSNGLGHGSAFIVTLPVAEGEPVSEVAAPAPAPAFASPPREAG